MEWGGCLLGVYLASVEVHDVLNEEKVANLSLENNLLTFQLNAPVVISAKVINIGKLFSKLKLVTDNLYVEATWEATEKNYSCWWFIHFSVPKQWFEIRDACMTRVEKAEKQVEKLFQDYQSRWREYAKCADKAGGADHVEVCNMYMQ